MHLGHLCLDTANKTSYWEGNYTPFHIIMLCKEQGQNTASLIFLMFSISFNKSFAADAVRNFNKTNCLSDSLGPFLLVFIG